ncbi:MAG TPA: hypothetical protein VG273_07695 [Bryobacteraceae bacterium]|jgi:hypothetical protein|nr:hypothetical protein [Bryobacteraceae bacterium]
MLIVVGGHSRNIGKTGVVCAILRALPEWNWTAIKITQFGHGVCSRNGEPCPCEDPVHPVAISPEEGYTPETDSGRFLASGAARAWWVRTPSGRLQEALPRLHKIIDPQGNTIIESNSILRFLRPDFCAMVLDGAVSDFKPSSLRFLDRAHALVVTSPSALAWPEVPQSLLRPRPRLPALAPAYESRELIERIRTSL